MHIAATDPLAVAPGDIDPALVEAERAIALEQVQASNKPAAIQEKMMTGKLKAFTEERALLTQVYVKDPAKKVQDLITAAVQELGENITVSSFSRLTI
jgi:elongation factor Ts